MEKELNKKQIKKNLSCDLIFIKSIFYQIVSSKILKNSRVKYVLVMYKLIYVRLAKKRPQNFMLSNSYIFIVCIMKYIVVLCH